MNINYDLFLIKNIINDLEGLTGASFSFLDKDKNPLFPNSHSDDFCSFIQAHDKSSQTLCNIADKALLEKCEKSRKLEKAQCHSKLYDAAMALVKNDVLCGFIIFGRIRSENSPTKPFFSGEEKEIAEKLYKQIPFLTAKQLDSLYDLMSHIFFEKAIVVEDLPLSQMAEEYVTRNLSADLSVSSLCKALSVNKNQLYTVFEDFFGMTVGEFVTNKRIDAAKEFLKDKDKPIIEIAEAVGLSNYSYFFRLFKKKTGLTPKQFRDSAKENNNA